LLRRMYEKGRSKSSNTEQAGHIGRSSFYEGPMRGWVRF
jgi:hypothetical protein